MNQRYRPGSRDRAWTKIRRRDTTEAIIGAITGTLTRPQLLILGRHDPTGRLRPVGRTGFVHEFGLWLKFCGVSLPVAQGP